MMDEKKINKILATVKVVELKKDKKYIFVFGVGSGLDSHKIDDFLTVLEDFGYKGIGLILEDLEEMIVIEK